MIDRLLLGWLFLSVLLGVGLFLALFIRAGQLRAFFTGRPPVTKDALVTGPVTRVVWGLAYGSLLSYFPALALFIYRIF